MYIEIMFHENQDGIQVQKLAVYLSKLSITQGQYFYEGNYIFSKAYLFIKANKYIQIFLVYTNGAEKDDKK